MKELFSRFWYDMAFFRTVVLTGVSWFGLALVNPMGRSLWEKLLYSAPVALGIGGAALSSSSGTRPNGNGGAKP